MSTSRPPICDVNVTSADRRADDRPDRRGDRHRQCAEHGDADDGSADRGATESRAERAESGEGQESSGSDDDSSPVHGGATSDPATTLEELLAAYVRPPAG